MGRRTEHITNTIDIGTVYDFPLLAVIFIGNKTAKLINILPLVSRKVQMLLKLMMLETYRFSI